LEVGGDFESACGGSTPPGATEEKSWSEDLAFVERLHVAIYGSALPVVRVQA